MINFIGVNLFFFTSLLILIICTNNDRNNFINFFIILLIFSFIFLNSHPAYIFGFSFVVFILLFFLIIGKKVNKFFLFSFTAALILSLTLTAFRTIPVYLSLSEGTAADPFYWERSYQTAQYLILTLFNPSMFGNSIGDSYYYFQAMNYPQGIHNAFHTSLYFGIGPLFIIITSLLYNLNKKNIILFAIFILMLFQSADFFEPSTDLINILFKPFHHSAVFKILSFFSFIFLFIYSLKNFLEIKFVKKNYFPKIVVIVSLIIIISSAGIYLDVISYLYNKEFIKFAHIANIIRLAGENIYQIIFKLIIFIGLLYITLNNKNWQLIEVDNFLRRILFLSIFLSLLIFSLSLIAHNLDLFMIDTESYLTLIKNSFLLITFIIFINYYSLGKIKKNQFLYLIFFLFFLSLSIGNEFKASNIFFSGHMSLLGWIGFLCLISIYNKFFYQLFISKISLNRFLVLFLMIHFIDLSISFKNNTFVNIWKTPFVKTLKDIYPSSPNDNNINLDKNEFEIIQKNFRFNKTAIIDNISANEMIANFGMLSKKFVYSGVDSTFPWSYFTFINNFLDENEIHKLTTGGVIGTVSNERFLDLIGVKVDIDKNNNIITRLNPLPRFSSFNSFSLMNSKDVLSELKKDEFKFTKKLLITKNSNNLYLKNIFDNKKNSKYKMLNYKLINNDHIKINIEESDGRVILFNDRYSKKWSAYWNNKKIDIHKANSIFMGLVLPDGKGILEFKFEPKLFNKLKNFSQSLSTIILVLFLLFLIINKFSFRKI